MTTPATRRWDESPLAAAALVLLACLVLWPYRRFAGDDAYITFRFAENFAAGHGFSFNPDQPTYGSTSPLWVFLLAESHRLGLGMLAASHLLDALFVLLTLAVFRALCRDYLRSPALGAVAAILLLVDPWFVRWSMSGMEGPAALFFFSATVLARVRARSHPRAAWLAPIWCGLGLMTRPEFAVLSLLVGFDILFFETRQRLARALAFAAITAAIITPWTLYAQHVFGSILPNTMLAKIGASRVAGLVGILKYFSTFYLPELIGLALFAALARGRWIAALGNAETRRRWFLPLAWAVALPSFYVLGAAPVSARYLFMGLPAYLLIGIKSWELLYESNRLPRPRAVLGALTAGALACCAAVQARYDWYLTRWPEGMDPRMVALGRWLHDHKSEGDLLAADQIGTIGFYAQIDTLDLAGLISPELRRYNRVGDGHLLWKHVAASNPQWLLVSRAQAALLPEIDSAYRELRLEQTVSVQREGASDVGRESTYLLYRTNWPRK